MNLLELEYWYTDRGLHNPLTRFVSKTQSSEHRLVSFGTIRHCSEDLQDAAYFPISFETTTYKDQQDAAYFPISFETITYKDQQDAAYFPISFETITYKDQQDAAYFPISFETIRHC
jgi:hypothetical protein